MAKRICSICGREMYEGFVYDDHTYYCSTDCLHHDFTDEEWDSAYESDSGYWTEWHEESFWKVSIAAGSVKRHLAYFETEEEALQFCYDNHWVWLDQNEFEWNLEVDEPCD